MLQSAQEVEQGGAVRVGRGEVVGTGVDFEVCAAHESLLPPSGDGGGVGGGSADDGSAQCPEHGRPDGADHQVRTQDVA